MGLLVIGPWALLIIYDILLYIFRSVYYELPVVGGRAKGRQRPRAPSLTECPSGHRRAFSFVGAAAPALDSPGHGTEAIRRRRKAGEATEKDDTGIEDS
jgi:hypothetical protein